MSEEQQKKSRIPEFKSLEEAAEFWDTHSTADFEDEFEPAELEPTPEFRRRVEEKCREKQRRRAIS